MKREQGQFAKTMPLQKRLSLLFVPLLSNKIVFPTIYRAGSFWLHFEEILPDIVS